MEFDAENLKEQIPHYLTDHDKKQLIEELKAILSGENNSFILSDYNDNFENEMLQGDGWSPFSIYEYRSSQLVTVRGLVLSNSCDISVENKRDIPNNLTISPIVKLAVFEKVLERRGVDKEKIAAKMEAIRHQRVSNILFLPSGGKLDDDSIVRFDECHSLPIPDLKEGKHNKLFTLSNTGFYILALKLSFHFCRLHEDVQRGF